MRSDQFVENRLRRHAGRELFGHPAVQRRTVRVAGCDQRLDVVRVGIAFQECSTRLQRAYNGRSECAGFARRG